jgi:hypothetical protein
MSVKVYVLLKQGDCSFALYLYCSRQNNVYSRCETYTETLGGVTCVELLAI